MGRRGITYGSELDLELGSFSNKICHIGCAKRFFEVSIISELIDRGLGFQEHEIGFFTALKSVKEGNFWCRDMSSLDLM